MFNIIRDLRLRACAAVVPSDTQGHVEGSDGYDTRNDTVEQAPGSEGPSAVTLTAATAWAGNSPEELWVHLSNGCKRLPRWPRSSSTDPFEDPSSVGAFPARKG
jgi:hypothetical protein